ncbi:hypothetical protein ACFQU1_24735 [Chelatococcus sp. GCM10030263]|uniref:hypothetical protein n=1 Tax=Chelatococcus sp. GCM10030263 TaxID=3273387 RepID=UPI00360B534D
MLHALHFATNWIKDDEYDSERFVEKIILDACKKSPRLDEAYLSGELEVVAGIHRKSGPGMGGDARPHITVRLRDAGEAWHIILNRSGGRYWFHKVETRPKVNQEFLSANAQRQRRQNTPPLPNAPQI